MDNIATIDNIINKYEIKSANSNTELVETVDLCMDISDEHENFIINEEKSPKCNLVKQAKQQASECLSEIHSIKDNKKTSKNGIDKLEKLKVKEFKKQEIQKEKMLKNAMKTVNKNLKADQCLKLITVIIDSNMYGEKYISLIQNQLNDLEIKYEAKEQLLPLSISWKRTIENISVNDNGEPILIKELNITNELLIVIKWDQLVQLVHDKKLILHIKDIKTLVPNKVIFLVLFGLENYFKYQKEPKKKYQKLYGKATKITRRQLEYALTELQLFCECCYRFIDKNEDLALLVVQFTKSIAQIPFKQEKNKKFEQVEWYMGSDNKDCVHVDKEGNGLKRLWTQQLTLFPHARLETAEAISSVYKTPSSLINAYKSITRKDGENLLQDIPIRRAAGALSSVRRIGPELSKKAYMLFTSTNGSDNL